jgi:hypothetical protein
MMREQDWVSRMWQTIAKLERVPFEYGKFDCAVFAGRCVDAITGSAFTEAFGVSDKRSAIAFLRREGGLEAAVTRRLGEPVPGYAARRGDVCLIDKKTLGICTGPTIAVLGNSGVEYLPLARAQKHWRVG